MKNEIYLIAGHRGTGKTAWLQQLKKYFSKKQEEALTFDIDQEIEKTASLSIERLFEKGESFFRKIENKTVEECLQKAKTFKGKVFISLGAGYSGNIPPFCKVIHLKRRSDSSGRIFSNRPRLFPQINAFDEYQKLYAKRKLLYRQQRDFVFTKLDYFKSFEKWDEIFLGDEKLPFSNGALTLNEKNSPSSSEKLNFFLDQRLKWGLKYFELKENEMSQDFLEKILLKLPLHKILFSFRQKNKGLFEEILNSQNQSSLTADWPLESRENSSIKNPRISWIYSLHERKNSKPLSQILNQLPQTKNINLKLAVNIFSFEELLEGHLWQKKDPARRSFHPRSKEGRWKWYRIIFGPKQPLYFIREDDEEGVLDQPVMAESVRGGRITSQNGWACVLGNPIEHSATPYEQQSFFEKYNLPIIPILMKEEEVSHANIKILEKLGMKFSAVTSPLKKKIYHVLNNNESQTSKKSLSSKNLVPVFNTLILTKKGWRGFNTDSGGALAFKQFIHQSDFSSAAVWGGGAVRDILDFVFSNTTSADKNPQNPNVIPAKAGIQQKNVSFYSARTGKILKGSPQNPEVLIWGVGRCRMPQCMYPPQHWKPLYVLDLNYTKDSPGLEYALKTKAQYLSGWLWFKAQAQAQRILFERLYAK